MQPKGKLLIIGGAEDKGDDDEIVAHDNADHNIERYQILKTLLSASKNKKMEIITTGSTVQHEVKNVYQKAFLKIGHENPGFISINNKIEARNKNYLERIEDAEVIFFTGGDQVRLSTILGGTKLIDLIKRKYIEDKSFLIAGTSAGAMVMSDVMITDGGRKEVIIDQDLKTSSGFNILHNCIIDTHFIKRGRFSRLAHAVIRNPDQLGIGLGENSALIIKHGTDAVCTGSGMVVIIDGKNIRQTNIAVAQTEDSIFVENLKVHILVKGCRFSIKSRRLFNIDSQRTK
jgi:cyanophycinase